MVVTPNACHIGACGFIPHSIIQVSKKLFPSRSLSCSVVEYICDREVAYTVPVRQGANFDSCVWMAVPCDSSHHPQEFLPVQFSLYKRKGGLEHHSFIHICRQTQKISWQTSTTLTKALERYRVIVSCRSVLYTGRGLIGKRTWPHLPCRVEDVVVFGGIGGNVLHTSAKKAIKTQWIYPLGYERVYLPLHKMADTPFHIQGDVLYQGIRRMY